MKGAILFADSKKIRPVSVSEILRFESHGPYTTVFIRNGESYISSRHLKDITSGLNPLFFIRIHKSHVVNVKEIAYYEKGKGGFVVMTDGSRVPVGRRRKSVLFEGLMSFKLPLIA